jgi:hypothetical protein
VVVLEAPDVAEVVEAIAAPVAITVRDPRQLGLLHRVDRAVPESEPEDLIEAGREHRDLRGGKRVEGTFDDQDLTAPRADREPTVRQRAHAACLELGKARQADLDDAVVATLGFGGAPRLAEFLCAKRQRRAADERGGREDLASGVHRPSSRKL